jgi:hypothetical protein
VIKAASFLSLGDVLGEICARHRIDAQDIQMPVDSSMQQVAIVNRQFVVRFATDPEAEVRLSAEAQLLESPVCYSYKPRPSLRQAESRLLPDQNLSSGTNPRQPMARVRHQQ